MNLFRAFWPSQSRAQLTAVLPADSCVSSGREPRRIGRFFRAIGSADLAAMFGAVDMTAGHFMANEVAGRDEFVPVLLLGPDEQLVLVPATLGIVTAWARADQPKVAVTASISSASRDPVLRRAFEAWRCLVPVHGHHEGPTPYDRDAGSEPLSAVGQINGGVMLAAGIFELVGRSLEDDLPRVTVLTKRCKDAVRAPLGQLPALVETENMEAWLDPAPASVQDLLPLLHALPLERQRRLTVHAHLAEAGPTMPLLSAPLTHGT